ARCFNPASNLWYRSAQVYYAGEAGRTTTEAVHLLEADGSARTRLVHTVVNVATDPKLGEAARAGVLNDEPGGVPLAVPFVYHDPTRSQFALVVPEALRHRALDERSALWDRIAEETECAVPRYVLACPVVIGARGLCAFLGVPEVEVRSPLRSPITPSWVGVRGDGSLADAEARLLAREDKLRRWAEELHRWEERLLDRERAVEGRAQLGRGLRDSQPSVPIELGYLDELDADWADEPTGVTGVRVAEPSAPPGRMAAPWAMPAEDADVITSSPQGHRVPAGLEDGGR